MFMKSCLILTVSEAHIQALGKGAGGQPGFQAVNCATYVNLMHNKHFLPTLPTHPHLHVLSDTAMYTHSQLKQRKKGKIHT